MPLSDSLADNINSARTKSRNVQKMQLLSQALIIMEKSFCGVEWLKCSDSALH